MALSAVAPSDAPSTPLPVAGRLKGESSNKADDMSPASKEKAAASEFRTLSAEVMKHAVAAVTAASEAQHATLAVGNGEEAAPNGIAESPYKSPPKEAFEALDKEGLEAALASAEAEAETAQMESLRAQMESLRATQTALRQDTGGPMSLTLTLNLNLPRGSGGGAPAHVE